MSQTGQFSQIIGEKKKLFPTFRNITEAKHTHIHTTNQTKICQPFKIIGGSFFKNKKNTNWWPHRIKIFVFPQKFTIWDFLKDPFSLHIFLLQVQIRDNCALWCIPYFPFWGQSQLRVGERGAWRVHMAHSNGTVSLAAPQCALHF